MRICCLLDHLPVPLDRGLRQRFANQVIALGEAGRVDLFIAEDADPASIESMRETFDVERIVCAAPVLRKISKAAKARALLQRQPLQIAKRDFSPLRRAFSDEMAAPYDVAFIAGQYARLALADVVGGPVVFDFPYLFQIILERAAGVIDKPRQRVGRAIVDRLNYQAWRSIEMEAPGRCDLTTVCSEVDRRILGHERVVVVPNGYDLPTTSLGEPSDVRNPPTLLYHGHMATAQNSDGAQFLVREVFPLLRKELPDVQLRIVGEANDAVRELGQCDGVTVTDWVPEIATELAGADAVIVPLRFGSGTRLKILESWAHRLPIVATSVGAEGLEARDNEHLLLADDAASLATACARTLTDRDLRVRLADNGFELFRQRYQWSAIRAQLAGLIRETAQGKQIGTEWT